MEQSAVKLLEHSGAKMHTCKIGYSCVGEGVELQRKCSVRQRKQVCIGVTENAT